MHEILSKLTAGQKVLDLGARSGSFRPESCNAVVVRFDLDRPPSPSPVATVQGDASTLPFRDGAFDAVIANHSLEHMT